MQTGNIFPACESDQKRKLSYDEDIYDYELSDKGELIEPDGVEKFDAKKTFLQLKRYAARQRKSKDVTPESDYASESNYQQNDSHNERKDSDSSWKDYDNVDVNSTDYESDDKDNDNDEDEDEDDDEKSCDMYEEFNLTLFKTPLDHVNDNESDTEDYEDNDDDDDDDDDEEDFLTTTFTWNLRNKPKLPTEHSTDLKQSEGSFDNVEEFNLQTNFAHRKSPSNEEEENILNQRQQIKCSTPEKELKLDKLVERSWPWADREKIIYKQSTCHLVPNKPLGLIEQRIQLLAKRNLLEHLYKSKNPAQ